MKASKPEDVVDMEPVTFRIHTKILTDSICPKISQALIKLHMRLKLHTHRINNPIKTSFLRLTWKLLFFIGYPGIWATTNSQAAFHEHFSSRMWDHCECTTTSRKIFNTTSNITNPPRKHAYCTTNTSRKQTLQKRTAVVRSLLRFF